MKSNRGASKTFKKTASGKFKRKKAYKSHILNLKIYKEKKKIEDNAHWSLKLNKNV
ncbi:MAG: 50S ribosomal protein L35 [Ignavibacteriales bacterium]|nr:50S ribosomal protein L35 [Ignavibacteriales bacterium]